MPEGRPAMPVALRRQVQVEAGHRCAIPTCHQVPVEMAHIDPWAKVQEHTFDNLIALCPTCHARYDRGEIDRLEMLQYKANLGVISGRYGDMERRLLQVFIDNRDYDGVELDEPMRFQLKYLLDDGIIVQVAPGRGEPVMQFTRLGPVSTIRYVLTDVGRELVRRLADGQPID